MAVYSPLNEPYAMASYGPMVRTVTGATLQSSLDPAISAVPFVAFATFVSSAASRDSQSLVRRCVVAAFFGRRL